jgi:monoamine oxidase
MAHTPLFRRFLQALQQAHCANLQAHGHPPSMATPAGWSRRRVLKTAALLGATGVVASALPPAARAGMPGDGGTAPVIAIIGGGLAGLQAAYQLQQAGVYATVYEARGRLGGRILSRRHGVGAGLVINLGGEFINTEHADMRALVQAFGLRLFNRRADAQRFPVPAVGFYFDGQIHTAQEVADLLRPLAAQIAEDAARLDRDFDRFAPPLDALSVTAYLDQHADTIPVPFIRTLVENSIRTEYGVEPEASSALQLIFNLPTVQGHQVEVLGASDETFVVEGGSSRLIQALAQALAGQIQTRMSLQRLEAAGSGFRLGFAAGQVVDADVVILAIPFTVLREVDLQVSLPPRLRRFIQEVDLGANEKLIAGFAQKVWRRADGFVKEAWTDLGFSEVWDATQRQPTREDGALTFFVGGREVEALQAGSATAQLERLLPQFARFIPGAEEAATGQVVRTHWTQSRWTRGGYTSFQPGQLTRFGDWLWVESDDPEERQEVHVGNLVFAGEHVSDEFYGFMNGAAQTGRLAAEFVLRQVHAPGIETVMSQ